MFSLRLTIITAILFGVAVLSACGGASSSSPTETMTVSLLPPTQTYTPIPTIVFLPTATPSQTSTSTPFPTFNPQSAAALARPTLPPTWTPTWTVTPSFTPTITNTPTITPTRTIDELCQSGVDLAFDWELRTYQSDDVAPIFASTDDPNTTIVFYAEKQHDPTITLEFTLPGGSLYFAGVPIESFPEPGIYDWKLSVTRGEETGLCAIQGTLTIKTLSLLDLMRNAYPTATPQN